MKDPKLINFTYANYLKITGDNGAKIVLQGWYRSLSNGTILTFNGKTYKVEAGEG